MRLLPAFCILIIGLAACSPVNQKRDEDPDAVKTRVKIDNQNVMSMTIFVVKRGQEVRLGFVPGQSKETLTIPKDIVTVPTTIRLLADPVGSNSTPISNEFFVSPGDTIEMLIRPF